MPGRAGIGQRCATDDAGAVHLPDGRRAVAALPEQVALSVAVEVAGADQVPGRAGIGKRRTADDAGAVHLPDRRGAVVVLPQQVALSVAVEVDGADQVPGRAGIGKRRIADDAGAVHLPNRLAQTRNGLYAHPPAETKAHRRPEYRTHRTQSARHQDKSWTSASGRRWISSAAQGPKVRRLPAGGNWIRTSRTRVR